MHLFSRFACMYHSPSTALFQPFFILDLWLKDQHETKQHLYLKVKYLYKITQFVHRVSTKTEPPPVLKPAVNVTSTVGGVAVLFCQVEGSMRHNLTWYRAGHTILARSGRVKLLSDSSLQISGVRTQDAGEYQCVATNTHGDNRITVWLLVPGTVGRYPAGHLLKYLTHWGLMPPLRPLSSVFHYWLNLLTVRLSHFLIRKCLLSAII